MLKRKLLYPALAMVSAAALLVAGPVQAWQPKKPVEFIIMAGTGGGADQIARLLQGLIEKKGLSSRPFIPINKPGGSGAEALRYLQDKAGDNHTVMMTLNSFYTTPIIQSDLGVDPIEFTPIGTSKPRFSLQFGNQNINIHQALFLSNHTQKFQVVGVPIFVF